MELSDPKYDMTGDGDPSPNGEYYETGMWLGKPYYRRKDGAYFIWWSPAITDWYITVALGDDSPGAWYRDVTIIGTYAPKAPYIGNPVVAAH